MATKSDPLKQVRDAAVRAQEAQRKLDTARWQLQLKAIEARENGATLRAIGDAAGVSNVTVLHWTRGGFTGMFPTT